jgi:predicted DNA-binding protein
MKKSKPFKPEINVSFNITRKQSDKLRRLALEKDRPMSYIIREAIDKMDEPTNVKSVKI